MKVLVIYDGSIDAKTALRYGIETVKNQGGELFMLQVFHAHQFIDYDAMPQAEEIARREAARHREEAERIMREEGRGLKTSIILREGNPPSEIIRVATIEHVDVIYATPRYKSIIRKAPCAVSIIPGNIIVPVDNNDGVTAKVDQIATEARSTRSAVVLLGLIPLHLYSSSEKEEMRKITAETTSVVRRMKEMLNTRGIKTRELIHSGYPDEEIVKVANECPVTMIACLTEGQRPSELNKAIAIILQEPDRWKLPVLSMQSVTLMPASD